MNDKCAIQDSHSIAGDLNGLLSGFLVRKRIEAVKPFLAGRKRICDIGCGVFRWDSMLAEEVSYTGIDAEEDIVRYNQGHFAHEFYKKNIEEDSLQDIGGSFDLVIMLAVIEHFRQPDAVLRKLQSILSPQGIIVLTTPHPCGDSILNLGARIGLFSNDKRTHHTLLNRRLLGEISLSAGFRVREYRRFLFGFNQLAILVPGT